MRKGYWIVHLDVEEPDAYASYGKMARAALEKFGGKLLIRSTGERELAEGTLRSRHVLVEFESYEQARVCYYSPEYQDAKVARERCASTDFLLIEGA